MKRVLALVAMAAMLAACQPQTIPPEALQLSPESMQNRQMQTRRFDMKQEKKLVGASMDVLQDLGYQLTESETKLGVLVAHKKADATEAGQVAGAIVVALLFGVVPEIDDNQVIIASLVVTPSQLNKKEGVVRIVFSREVTGTQNRITRRELIVDPTIYQQFFDKLSKSVFLKENEA